MTMKDVSELYNGPTDISITTPLDTLFGKYIEARQSIEQIAEYVENNNGAMSYFFEGARVSRNIGTFSANTFFERDHAIASLNAEYWSKVINMTDVLDAMPAKMRNEWHKQIHEHKTPEFERKSVLATMNDMLMQRAHYFSMRVDGLFRALSGEHVTNQPEAFGKRMIINRMMTYYHTVNHDTGAYIHDLRAVIGKFMGREVPNSRATDYDISRIYDRGDTGIWHSFDGGALRLKLFKKGTAHLEIHPQMAYRLNQILAQLYPMAIPEKFRKKPLRMKEHVIKSDLLSFEVLSELNDFSRETESCFYFRNELSVESKEVLKYIGGESFKNYWWEFNYPVMDALYEIIRSGQLPEKISHQFFQTPEALAQHVVDLACIEDDNDVLEPSAGLGAIAQHLPCDNTTCVEISRVHCKVLESKGYKTVHKDFIQWDCDKRFDRIIMNPPYAQGRALEHLTKAHSLLKQDGKLTAILPASMKDKNFFDDWKHEWSDVLTNEFKESGTGVNVAILSLSH